MYLVSLGKRILRTETAGLATLSILMYHIESVSEAEEERDQPLSLIHIYWKNMVTIW